MKKKDWLLVAVILVVSALGWGIHFFHSGAGQARVEVHIDGVLLGSWPLAEDHTVEIGETNRLAIKDGQADMIWADCPDLLCVHQHKISRVGESIICLPNKVVVSIVGEDPQDVDAVVN